MKKGKKDDLTAEELRSLISYDLDTGEFRWLVSSAHRIKIGDIAGSRRSDNYWCIVVRGWNYNAQRLAWLYVTGRWPAHHIDHEDLDKTNNRWSNLREATRSQNGSNRALLSNNTSGFKGVSWHARLQKWQAYITCDGRRRYLGYFSTVEDASRAYLQNADDLFGRFARVA